MQYLPVDHKRRHLESRRSGPLHCLRAGDAQRTNNDQPSGMATRMTVPVFTSPSLCCATSVALFFPHLPAAHGGLQSLTRTRTLLVGCGFSWAGLVHQQEQFLLNTLPCHGRLPLSSPRYIEGRVEAPEFAMLAILRRTAGPTLGMEAKAHCFLPPPRPKTWHRTKNRKTPREVKSKQLSTHPKSALRGDSVANMPAQSPVPRRCTPPTFAIWQV